MRESNPSIVNSVTLVAIISKKLGNLLKKLKGFSQEK